MLDNIMNWLKEEKKWYFSKVDNENILVFQLQLKADTIINCVFDVKEEHSIVLFYSILPQIVPKFQKNKIFKLLHQLNYNLLIGNFEFDSINNQIRFKTSFYWTQNLFEKDILEKNMEANINMIQYGLPKINLILGKEIYENK